MIHDAKVEVTCDGEKCQESIEIQPDYTYSSYSEHSGSYDTRDSALEGKIKDEGWKVVEGKHYCESCAEDGDK